MYSSQFWQYVRPNDSVGEDVDLSSIDFDAGDLSCYFVEFKEEILGALNLYS